MKPKIWLYLGLAIIAVRLLWSSIPLLYTPSPKQLAADKVRDIAVKKISSTKPLRLIGEGAQMLDEIEILSLYFQCIQNVDFNTARQLIIYASETLINEVNSSTDIRPYLKNYPFTANNVEISKINNNFI